MIDVIEAKNIVSKTVKDYQKEAGKTVYLDKRKYWYYVGCVRGADSWEMLTVMDELHDDLQNALELSEKTKIEPYKRIK